LPFLGTALGFIAYLWGLGIYIKGTASSHQLSLERALLAVILPILILLLLVFLGVAGLGTLIAISAAGGSH
jgi:hypothetical protein